MTGTYEDITYREDGAVAHLTLAREDSGNMFRRQTCLELLDALRHVRVTPRLRVVVLRGAGDRFFCLGGEKEEHDTLDHSAVMPIVEVYEMIDCMPKPVIAAVNGYAVGGGHVLHMVCDLSIASDRAVFRQVGPMVGSFDAGYGTWYLEDTIGRKRAKELWYLNRKYAAEDAERMGLVNEVVAHEQLDERVAQVCAELLDRGPQALAALKAAFSARHTGVAGQARVLHDLLLTRYLRSDEAEELAAAFRERRAPDHARFDR